MKIEYKVEKGIKLGNKSAGRTGAAVAKYPFKEMKVDDSFQVGEFTVKRMNNVAGAAREFTKRGEDNRYKKFVTRRVLEKDLVSGDEKWMVRIWRVK